MRNNDVPAFEHLQADLFRLMNRYSGQPCHRTADAIAMVIEGLLRHPLIDVFPEFREQCTRGLGQWRLRAVPRPGLRAASPSHVH